MRLLSVGLTLKVDSGFRHLSGLSRTSFSHRISRSQDITNDLPRSSDARNAGLVRPGFQRRLCWTQSKFKTVIQTGQCGKCGKRILAET